MNPLIKTDWLFPCVREALLFQPTGEEILDFFYYLEQHPISIYLNKNIEWGGGIIGAFINGVPYSRIERPRDIAIAVISHLVFERPNGEALIRRLSQATGFEKVLEEMNEMGFELKGDTLDAVR